MEMKEVMLKFRKQTTILKQRFVVVHLWVSFLLDFFGGGCFFAGFFHFCFCFVLFLLCFCFCFCFFFLRFFSLCITLFKCLLH